MAKNEQRLRNQDTNPCMEESDASIKCVHTNKINQSMCSDYFQRYQNCRKYWHNIMLKRRREGVKPVMPTAAERREMLSAIGSKPY
ncbi:coiled-coil-helix-coiled-coil-helix domain-containing protein 7 [Cynoglossus semilaevis]|uniref:Coiled-coil-helix-coiled-coil-helix domain-containing protein 7 n=1 Tax=Cynoglossus semilaevis TaxID=244447 RepID=A0A3P8VKE1_CYNSE|nr:coiled-coil-helix-coiled-coil-helix domain-containing protein 7 [Cynoglossus semilaevis]XP_008305601.1 coiled-coil-helix-coiled-coil-helix domain-containing protein 7 [Cynoglossus semilaevis]